MDSLFDALVKLRDHKIAGEQTAVIDQTLSLADANDISDNDLINVIDYIDAELLHNRVEPEIESRLIGLRAVLALRR